MFSLRLNSIAESLRSQLRAVFADLVHNFKTKMMDSLRSWVFMLASLDLDAKCISSQSSTCSVSFVMKHDEACNQGEKRL